MQTDDHALILRAQHRDDAAFESLVRRYDHAVLSIALRYTGDPEAAKDIYQEVFLRVHIALPRFRWECRFSTWLYRIAVNCCLNYRTSGRSRNLSLEGEVLDQGGPDGGGHRLPQALISQANSMNRTLVGEIRARLERAFDLLSPQQRLVFTLRHFQGCKLKEIADCLNCAEGTVKKHLFSGTRRLREELRELR